ncbi:putative signal transducing protein [Mucilaginibacter antarcticus]|uniref:Signal transducing protein n=1 Tax=Mucilaginibacter antarcticus TaxID=1855725 RepID=A0ABW5XLK1_9SPHI
MKDKIVTLDAYYSLMEAEIIRGRLEANDISCFIADDNILASNPAYNQMIGGFKVKVFEHDIDACRKVLAEEVIVQDGGELWACPDCASTNVFYGPAPLIRNWFYIVVALFTGGTYPPYFNRTWICKDCGANFKLLKEEPIEN